MKTYGPPEVNAFIDEAINLCRRSLEAGDPWRARLAVSSAARHCHAILQEPSADLTGDDRSAVLFLGILAAAYRDFTDCFELLKKGVLSHKEIERLWVRLVDCQERTQAVEGLLGGPGFDWLAAQVSSAYQHVLKQVGSGLYFSPVIVVKRESCNICGKDIRACAHRAGVIYDGKRCRGVVEDMEVRSCDLVRVPHDRRCRMWPWNFDTKTNRGSAAIFTSFDVDDLTDPRERELRPEDSADRAD